jgi:hypothetical protein
MKETHSAPDIEFQSQQSFKQVIRKFSCNGMIMTLNKRRDAAEASEKKSLSHQRRIWRPGLMQKRIYSIIVMPQMFGMNAKFCLKRKKNGMIANRSPCQRNPRNQLLTRKLRLLPSHVS